MAETLGRVDEARSRMDASALRMNAVQRGVIGAARKMAAVRAGFSQTVHSPAASADSMRSASAEAREAHGARARSESHTSDTPITDWKPVREKELRMGAYPSTPRAAFLQR